MANWEKVGRFEAEDGRVKIEYEVGGYEVSVADCTWLPGNLRITVSPLDVDGYLPKIYINDHYGRFQEVQIQTTSYGPLSFNEIDDVIRGYRIAQAVAYEIMERYPQCFERPESSPVPKFGCAENFAIAYGRDDAPVDRNDPESAETAIRWSLPSWFCKNAKTVYYKYFEGSAYVFEYKGRLVVTDESLELTEYGDGSADSPLSFPR